MRSREAVFYFSVAEVLFLYSLCGWSCDSPGLLQLHTVQSISMTGPSCTRRKLGTHWDVQAGKLSTLYALKLMQRCCEDIRTWMRGNFLKLNGRKTEVAPPRLTSAAEEDFAAWCDGWRLPHCCSHISEEPWGQCLTPT